MILVLGADSYIGRIFCAELRRRGHDFTLPANKDYSDFDSLFDCIRKAKPEFIINAAGRAGAPDVDACEVERDETLHANTILPHSVAKVCLMTNTPWGHVSSCGIYSGAKIAGDDGLIIGKKIRRADLLRLLAECPEKIHGFTESDEPNFSFRDAPCNFFSGTAALAEESIRGIGRNYIWRIGLPFNERDDRENFLQQIQNVEKIYRGVGALSHTGDFVRACLDLWELRAPFGIYNVANPGVVTSWQIVERLRKILQPKRDFEFWEDDAEFYRGGNRALRSDCVLEVSKLLAAGVPMRPAAEALEDSLQNWRAENVPQESRKAA
ncbi:MAG TPA: sugar nucleotide-binding protein [Methylomirabilota bacterium]|nr:sugar nucleotide-binding protein [Methylomirabilota bacterium]